MPLPDLSLCYTMFTAYYQTFDKVYNHSRVFCVFKINHFKSSKERESNLQIDHLTSLRTYTRFKLNLELNRRLVMIKPAHRQHRESMHHPLLLLTYCSSIPGAQTHNKTCTLSLSSSSSIVISHNHTVDTFVILRQLRDWRLSARSLWNEVQSWIQKHR